MKKYFTIPLSKVIKGLAIPIISLAVVYGGFGVFLLAKSNVAAAAPSSSFYGMNWHPMWINPGGQDAEIGLMKKTGIETVRIDAEWAQMEPASGTYNPTYLSRLDNAINQLDAVGIQPLVVVTSTPKWVSGAPSGDPSPYAEPPIRTTIGAGCNPSVTICHTYNKVANYTVFLSFLMHRWHGKVHEYEMWNEPDGGWSWKSTKTNYLTAATDRAIDYTTLLKAAYRTAKSIDPSVTVLGGSLSGTALAQQTFLKTMYQHGAKNYFDVYSQHYYCDPPGHNYCSSNRSTHDPGTLAATFTNNMYPILKANGDGSKPVWVTETGYNTDAAAGGVTESQQAQYLTQSFNYAANLPSVARLYWYDMDCTDSGSSYQNYYCILQASMYNANSMPSYRLKPAYTALQQLTANSTSSGSAPTSGTSSSSGGSSGGSGGGSRSVTRLRINAGGTTYTGSNGNAWKADTDYSGGSRDDQAAGKTIAGTATQTIYQSERWGKRFSYKIRVADNLYQVTLDFAQIYPRCTTAGCRVFNVSVNGIRWLTNFDIARRVGAYTALQVSETVKVTNGYITIRLTGVKGSAQLAGIEVVRK